MCGILGIRINKGGELGGKRDSFTVCNHISYLDIFVIGSVSPSVFLAKHDVRNWPIAGWMRISDYLDQSFRRIESIHFGSSRPLISDIAIILG
jgi:hypothetical protein